MKNTLLMRLYASMCLSPVFYNDDPQIIEHIFSHLGAGISHFIFYTFNVLCIHVCIS